MMGDRNSLEGVSLIVPAYNEVQSIESTLRRLRKILGSLNRPFEIIVVDDGSTDKTVIEARKVASVRIESHPLNIGYGAAIKTGIRNSSYEIIGIVDADGTYDIEGLPSLLEDIDYGFHMVVASRENVSETDTFIKGIARSILLWSLNILIAAKIRDPNSGFRLFQKSLALTYFPFLCNSFSFTTSITLFALGDGYFVKYVPMQYGVREGKSKVRHFRDSLRMVQLIFQGVTFANPLKLFVLLAVFYIFIFGFPAIILVFLGLIEIAWIYLTAGSTVTLLLALGVLTDMYRLVTLNQEKSPTRKFFNSN